MAEQDAGGPRLVEISPHRGPIAGPLHSIASVWARRDLLGLLVRRELRARYKDSQLGFLWSLLRPLTQFLIYYIAIGKFLQAERSIPEFAIFVFTGLTVWGLFSEIVNGSTNSILTNSGLVKKVYLPRELFPLSAVGSALVNSGIQFGILAAAILVTRQFPTNPWALLTVPLALLTLIIFATAIGMILAAATVTLRDFQHLVEVGLMVLFWASPIVYSFAMVHGALQGGVIEQIYLANPVTVVVMIVQEGLWAAGQNNPAVYWPDGLVIRLLIMFVVSLVLLWVAQRYFSRKEGDFAQDL